MSKQNSPIMAYVRRVSEETERFAQDALSENERLRKLIADLQLEADNQREKLALAERELAQQRPMGEAAEAAWGGAESDGGSLLTDYETVRQQNANLVNLYVSSFRLSTTLDREDILETILEIVVNLVGSEEVGVFELDRESSSLCLIRSMGIDQTRYKEIPVGSGLISRVVQSGDLYVCDGVDGDAHDGVDEEDGMTVCIPLKANDETRWVISIFGLLEHKGGIETIDRELFDLLADQAGTALYCAELHAKANGAVTRA